ncbi:hypothetical protein IGI04_030262 [Brassica rapa subsp. trilocularis]|uniref:RRM domain-containing protein n=1 Tax=Brassica rapa subsp. trilocularis TaxID=1813537 RepID=A0ABQ7LSJ4_BRACM|nr:hypothetical protein IGI04_030262 [Brassica rapa subsp. trilocularis]
MIEIEVETENIILAAEAMNNTVDQDLESLTCPCSRESGIGRFWCPLLSLMFPTTSTYFASKSSNEWKRCVSVAGWSSTVMEECSEMMKVTVSSLVPDCWGRDCEEDEEGGVERLTIAYIDFKERAEKAYDLNGTELGGWNILVDEAKSRDSSGGGFSGGGGGHFCGGGGHFGGGGSSGGGRGRDNGGGRGFSKPSYIPSGKKTTLDD